MPGEQYETGLKIRKQVLGEEYVERALANAGSFADDFQDWVTSYAWGGPWARAGLALRDRSLINLAMLIALNRGDEFKLHLRGAINNGCTLDEIREVLLQATMYCGFPAGVTAFRLTREVFADLGIDPDKDPEKDPEKEVDRDG